MLPIVGNPRRGRQPILLLETTIDVVQGLHARVARVNLKALVAFAVVSAAAEAGVLINGRVSVEARVGWVVFNVLTGIAVTGWFLGSVDVRHDRRCRGRVRLHRQGGLLAACPDRSNLLG